MFTSRDFLMTKVLSFRSSRKILSPSVAAASFDVKLEPHGAVNVTDASCLEL